MYQFGKKSEERLIGVHPALVRVVRRALSYGFIDFSVNEGLRTKWRQAELFSEGATRTMDSKHLKQADGYGHAVDLYPYPVDMARINSGDVREIVRFGLIAGLMHRAAQEEGVKIIWGADWNGNGQTLDHSFFDAPHFELVSA